MLPDILLFLRQTAYPEPQLFGINLAAVISVLNDRVHQTAKRTQMPAVMKSAFRDSFALAQAMSKLPVTKEPLQHPFSPASGTVTPEDLPVVRSLVRAMESGIDCGQTQGLHSCFRSLSVKPAAQMEPVLQN